MTFTPKTPYNVIDIAMAGGLSDFSKIHNDDEAVIANTMTILTLDDGILTFKINSADNDSITASDGLKIEGVVITDLLWSCDDQDKTAKVFLAWVD